ncbi:MAG: heme ABC exporter ATP-binding protein CcmA [Deinococcota bacterium]
MSLTSPPAAGNLPAAQPAAASVTPPSAVALMGVSKRYGTQLILHNLNLDISIGKTVLLWGSNGAGKTTLLKLMASRLRPSAGSGQIFGLDLVKQASLVRQCVCYAPVLGGFYGSLSGQENLELARHFYDKPQEARDDALNAVGLWAAKDRLVRSYSSGMKKRLALAKMQLSGAPLWLLDEPYASLDQDGKRLVDELVSDAAARGHSIIIASHDVQRVQAFANGIIYLDQGQLFARAPGDEAY